MIFKYYLDRISVPYYIFKVYINDDVFELEIDLIHKYPKYTYVHNKYNSQFWYYTLIKSNNDLNIEGEVIRIDMTKYREGSYPKFIIHNKNEYRIAEQMDLDKFHYIFNHDNDNKKLFQYIYNYLIFYYKNQYKQKEHKIHKIKNKYNETLL